MALELAQGLTAKTLVNDWDKNGVAASIDMVAAMPPHAVDTPPSASQAA
jgi:hypothetical protein